jgi:hypothetical protein
MLSEYSLTLLNLIFLSLRFVSALIHQNEHRLLFYAHFQCDELLSVPLQLPCFSQMLPE